MKIILLLFSLFMATYSNSQNFDGFVVTESDSLYKGYMQISNGPEGRRILITNNKKKKPRSYYLNDLKYYAYKKDTFALLHAFFPFEGEDYMASGIEGKYIISKGAVKLYYAEFPDYHKGNQSPGVMVGVGGYSAGVGNTHNKPYSTYVIKDREGNLFGIKEKKKDFFKSVEVALGDDLELMKRIEKNELGYRDMKEIVNVYNTNKSLHP